MSQCGNITILALIAIIAFIAFIAVIVVILWLCQKNVYGIDLG